MKKSILLLTALILSGCLMSKESEPEMKFIGFGGGCLDCAPLIGWTAWSISQKPRNQWYNNPQTFTTIFGRESDQNAGRLGPNTRTALQLGLDSIFDAGGHCLTFRQDGIDTIMIDKKAVIVSVPIEPCFPYYLETLWL